MQVRRTINKSSASLDEAKRNLLVGESPATRANAARVLGAIGKHRVIEYLIAALSDSAAQVRCAAVETLAEIGDPAAIEPLKALLLRETKNEVPETVIQHAIYSIVMLEARRRSEGQQPGREEFAPKEKVTELNSWHLEAELGHAKAEAEALEVQEHYLRGASEPERPGAKAAVESLLREAHQEPKVTRLNATATAQAIEEMRQLAAQLGALREKLQAEAPQRAAEIQRIQRELEALQAPEGEFAGSNGSAAAAQETLRLAAEETEGRAKRESELQLREDSLRRALHSIQVSRQRASESSSSKKRFCPECQTRVQLGQLKCHYCGEQLVTTYLVFAIIALSIVAVVLLVLVPSHVF